VLIYSRERAAWCVWVSVSGQWGWWVQHQIASRAEKTFKSMASRKGET